MSASKKACITCSQEFSGDEAVCPNDGTILTPLMHDRHLGTVLAGRYEILEVIGGGGMGLVYKARHTMMNRIVAIKMLHSHLTSSAEALGRFKLEAQAASCLSLPNILQIFDFGVSDEGQPYMVMDYLEGTSLADVLEAEGRLPVLRAVNIFVQACAGLAHAHQKGVIHRDLKPSNIMLVNADDQADFVKIVDFGIAKLLNRTDGASANLTRTGEVYGSPLYMSPEQCRGQELDARSDLYSFGCVMYKTVTGQPVFTGSEMIELLFKQVSEMPKRFAEACPDTDLPADFEAIVFKAIAKNPNNRFQSMTELKDVLEAYKRKLEGGEPEQGAAPSAVSNQAAPSAMASGASRVPRVTGPLASAMAHKHAPGGQSVSTVDNSVSAIPSRSESAAHQAAAQSGAAAASTGALANPGPNASAAAQAQAIRREISGTFPPVCDDEPTEEPPASRRGGTTTEQPRPSSQTPIALRDHKGAPPPTTKAKPDWMLMSIMHNPAILAAVAVLFIATGALAFLAMRSKLPFGNGQPAEQKEVTMLETEAGLAMKANDPKQAIDLYQHAEQLEGKVGEDNPVMARLTEYTAKAYLLNQDYQNAESQISRSIAIHEKLANDPTALARCLTLRAEVYLKQGASSTAESDLKRAMEIEQKEGIVNPETKQLLEKIGGTAPGTTTGAAPGTTPGTDSANDLIPDTTTGPTTTSGEPKTPYADSGQTEKTTSPTNGAHQGEKPKPPVTEKPPTNVKQTENKNTEKPVRENPAEKPGHRTPAHHSSSRPPAATPPHRHAYSSYH